MNFSEAQSKPLEKRASFVTKEQGEGEEPETVTFRAKKETTR